MQIDYTASLLFFTFTKQSTIAGCNKMKLKAVILLVCFFGLLTGTESFAAYIEAVKKATQTCSNNNASNEEQNQESCCNSNTVSTVYVAQKGYSYTPATSPIVDHVAYVVNHYSMSYLSGIWRPPADVVVS
nr:hypothetical protein [uncultured Lacibacter sp.]